jgi:transglutaminase-like putative cysteine protease
MQYVVRHLTRFTYTAPVSESVTELRMQPLERDGQRCLQFDVRTTPRARLFAYRDHFGNAVHYFSLPGHHGKLEVSAESVVELHATPDWPRQIEASAWDELDAIGRSGTMIDWLLPGGFTQSTAALEQFALAINLGRRRDPMTTLRALTRDMYQQFAYEPRSTQVDSSIDEALRARAGVCQDFSHIMATLVRQLGIPCRYVSGYLVPSDARYQRASDDATHAWIEAWLPGPGWVGLDPTNNTLTGDRHIAVAVGRDYSEVPPTRGVFKGEAGSELSVAVAVEPRDGHSALRDLSPSVSWITPPRAPTPSDDEQMGQQ